MEHVDNDSYHFMDSCFLHDLLALLEKVFPGSPHLQIDSVGRHVVEQCVILVSFLDEG